MFTMYDATIPPIKRALTNLSAILKKGEDYADAKKIEPAVLLNARLFPDMYPVSYTHLDVYKRQVLERWLRQEVKKRGDF